MKTLNGKKGQQNSNFVRGSFVVRAKLASSPVCDVLVQQHLQIFSYQRQHDD